MAKAHPLVADLLKKVREEEKVWHDGYTGLHRRLEEDFETRFVNPRQRGRKATSSRAKGIQVDEELHLLVSLQLLSPDAAELHLKEHYRKLKAKRRLIQKQEKAMNKEAGITAPLAKLPPIPNGMHAMTRRALECLETEGIELVATQVRLTDPDTGIRTKVDLLGIRQGERKVLLETKTGYDHELLHPNRVRVKLTGCAPFRDEKAHLLNCASLQLVYEEATLRDLYEWCPDETHVLALNPSQASLYPVEPRFREAGPRVRDYLAKKKGSICQHRHPYEIQKPIHKYLTKKSD